MANDNKNRKELVSEDTDHTPELEAVTWRNPDAPQDSIIATRSGNRQVECGSSARMTSRDVNEHLWSGSEAADRLQFEVERLRSQQRGLETEVRARETQTRQLGKQIEALSSALQQATKSNRAFTNRIRSMQRDHEQEIRTLRFELGEAEETAAQQELISEQLASDLQDTRGFKVELERMLTESESHSQAKITELEADVARLTEVNEELERELSSRNEVIRGLLEELSGMARQKDSISDLRAAIHEMDDRVAERIQERPPGTKDRVTRLLVGSGDGRELRFPLFKKRLTIGRAQQNDIQVDAPYISRRHAVVVTEGDFTRLIDWGSKNGVYVNSQRVTEHFLTSGDVVTIGTAEFRYEERARRDN